MAVDVESGMPLLAVYDVPTAIAFYRDVLGFEVVHTSPPFDGAKDNCGWAHLRKNRANLMLNSMFENNERPAKVDADRSKHHRDTTLYFMCRDVDGVSDYLREKGIAVRGPVDTYYGMRQVQVFDPDGYSLVFQWPIEKK